MPWSVADVDRFKKGLSPKAKKQWVGAANAARSKCLAEGGSEKVCDGRAVRIANGVVEMNMTKDEKLKRLYEEFPTVPKEKVEAALKEYDFTFARIALAITEEDNGGTSALTGIHEGQVY